MDMPRSLGLWSVGNGAYSILFKIYDSKNEWNDGLINFAFWAMNIGLMMMCVLSLLPVGLMQTWRPLNMGIGMPVATIFYKLR